MGNNLRDLRRRIRSVKSTQQITRAMKLVAASKLRRAQEEMERFRPYGQGMRQVVANVAARAGADSHPLLEKRAGNRLLLVVMTGDRGLAGSFNANVLRGALRFLEQNRDRDITLELVGRKARDFFKKRRWPIRAGHSDIYKAIDFGKSHEIAQGLIHAFVDEGFDEVRLLSNRFRTVMAQDLVMDQILPVVVAPMEEGAASIDYIYEPDPVTLLEGVIPLSIDVLVHQALLESNAAEQGARMVAMENATKNAGEMIDRLTLQLNRTRQAAITTEIIEIVSGAAALGK
jgi:F-type H+-transporting ATPase subunit gamma